MNNINISDILRIGHWLRYWEEYSNGFYKTWLRGEKIDEIGLLDTFENAIEIIKKYDCCLDTTTEISAFKDKIHAKYKIKDELDEEDEEYLKRRVNIWHDRLKTNFSNINVFLLDNEYLLNPKQLSNGAREFFSEKSWVKLSENSRKDLDECCRCILFELPTSAGFIALRATESVLRQFYSRKTGNNLDKYIKWKKIIDELKSQDTNNTLLGHLDYLRENLRNKLSHPDSFLDQKESEKIFLMIVMSIEEMTKEL